MSGAETSTLEAETIQVAEECFPNWDSHPSLIGPLPSSPAEQSNIDSLILPRAETKPSLYSLSSEEDASSFLLRHPLHGSLE